MENWSNLKNSLKSDEAFENIIENRQKYLPETVEEAIAELQSRGRAFSNEELKTINDDIKTRHDNVKRVEYASSGIFNNNHKYNLVEDPDAPLLYSRRVIYVFTIFFGALFGSIMFAINSGKVKNQLGSLWVLAFGVLFTAIQVVAAGYVNIGSSYPILCGLIAGLFIDRVFWNRFIGNSTFYRARPYWVPLIIGFVLAGLVIWSIIYGAGQ